MGQTPVGKIPQRPLARNRLVDHGRVADAAQEVGGGRRREAAGERQLGAHQVRRGHQASGGGAGMPVGVAGLVVAVLIHLFEETGLDGNLRRRRIPVQAHHTGGKDS